MLNKLGFVSMGLVVFCCFFPCYTNTLPKQSGLNCLVSLSQTWAAFITCFIMVICTENT